LPVGLGLFAVRLALSAFLRSDDFRRAIVLLLAVGTQYAIPTLTPMETYFLGAMFYGVFVVAGVLNLTAIFRLLKTGTTSLHSRPVVRLWPVQLILLLIVSGIFVRTTFGHHPPLATTFDERSRQEMRASSQELWSVLERLATASPTRQLTVAFSTPYPVSPALIQLYAERKHLSLSARPVYSHRRLDDILTDLSSADVAVVSSSIPHNLPGPQMGDDIIRSLDGRGDQCVLASWEIATTSVLRVYGNGRYGCPQNLELSRP
jgi:hypothetical protein